MLHGVWAERRAVACGGGVGVWEGGRIAAWAAWAHRRLPTPAFPIAPAQTAAEAVSACAGWRGRAATRLDECTYTRNAARASTPGVRCACGCMGGAVRAIRRDGAVWQSACVGALMDGCAWCDGGWPFGMGSVVQRGRHGAQSGLAATAHGAEHAAATEHGARLPHSFTSSLTPQFAI